MRTDCRLTGLSGNEIFCTRFTRFTPSGVVIGNSIQSMGLPGAIGGIRAAFRSFVKGEIGDLTTLINDAREHIA